MPKGTTALPQMLGPLLNLLFSFIPFSSPSSQGHGHLCGQFPGPAAESLRLHLPGCSCKHWTAALPDHRLHRTGFDQSPAPAPPAAQHQGPGSPQRHPRLPGSGAFPCTHWDAQGKQGSRDGRDPVAGPCSGVRRHRSAGTGVTMPALCRSPHMRARVAPHSQVLCTGHGHSRSALAPARKGRGEAQTQP